MSQPVEIRFVAAADAPDLKTARGRIGAPNTSAATGSQCPAAAMSRELDDYMTAASVVTNPEFIADVESDSLMHWRLGRFKFLTGDDKSSWYSLMRLGYDTFYVPDAAINTVEHPPEKSFIKASRKLMFRWYGNNLRQMALEEGVANAFDFPGFVPACGPCSWRRASTFSPKRVTARRQSPNSIGSRPPEHRPTSSSWTCRWATAWTV